MALCESNLGSALPQMSEAIEQDSSSKTEVSSDGERSPKKESTTNGSFDTEKVPPNLPLSVDYTSPISHFIPPAVEMYAAMASRSEPVSAGSSESSTPVKRKRGRPRIDKTSPEYLAKATRPERPVVENVADTSNNSNDATERRKRGRPRVDKTSPEYLARKHARELEALEKKAKRQNKRRGTNGRITKPVHLVKRMNAKTRLLMRRKGGNVASRAALRAKMAARKDSGASSSAGDSTPRVKRKYTKRPGSKPGRPRKDPNVINQSSTSDKAKGKRGRPRKTDGSGQPIDMKKSAQPGKIRVRSNLMPFNSSEPILVDSDDDNDLGSPSRSDSISFDENLQALRHLHEKYKHLQNDDTISPTLHERVKNDLTPKDAPNVGANGHKSVLMRDMSLPDLPYTNRIDDNIYQLTNNVTRIEKLDDSSNSGSESSSSNSGSSSSSSSSSSSDDSDSSSSDSSDDENDGKTPNGVVTDGVRASDELFAYKPAQTNPDDSARSSSSILSRKDEDSLTDASISHSDNESPDKSYQCHHCHKWYSTQVTLKIHRRTHQSRSSNSSRPKHRSAKYECDQCNEKFGRREKLMQHRASYHRSSVCVRCSVCSKCFEDEQELAQHENTHTPNERNGRCSVCGQQFPRHDLLRRHLSSHASDHSCSQCGKKFTHQHSLARHMLNHQRQLYRCVVCKASFAVAEQLAEHLNSHLATYKRLKP